MICDLGDEHIEICIHNEVFSPLYNIAAMLTKRLFLSLILDIENHQNNEKRARGERP